MSQPPAPGPPFPSERAFVVQFQAEDALGQSRYVGRVEHVVSGHAARFDTLAALLEFMVQVLTTQRPGWHDTASLPPAEPAPVSAALPPGLPPTNAL